MGQHFRHLTGAGYGFSAIFNASRMNGDDPLISLDLSADGVSYAPVFHMVHLMPRGPKGEKRPADVIGAAVMVGHNIKHTGYPQPWPLASLTNFCP
jgi:hypothetical protein